MTEREETTLDPADWSELRALGHQMIDDMFEYLATVRNRPVWQPVPPEIRARFQSPMPTDPSPAADVYREFKANVLPYPTGNIHPRFWGWVMGTGSPVAMLADLLASGMNAHLAGYDQSASLVEEEVLRWLSGLFGFPGTSTGVLTSSGTVANLIGLTVARHVQAGFDVRRIGLQGGGDAPRLIVYCSSEAHTWSRKAVELLGLGAESLRLIAVDSNYRMVVPALRAAIDDDRARGMRPLCVVASAGTVNTGATDDLEAIAAICREQRIWFHVDGAFGAFAKLAPDYAHTVDGLELADSLAVDLHKWMYMPFEAGCVLVRDGTAHHDAFAITPQYLKSLRGGIAPQPLAFAARGLDLSRGFRALKIWFSLKVHGASLFGRLVAQNIEQAQYLAGLIAADPQLELVAPVALNIVCFRYRPANADNARVNEINESILVRLQESGAAVPSSTVLDGRFAIRVAITNHRSRREDFELLAKLVTALGREIEKETQGSALIGP